jgi:phage FluMu protein Com
MPKASKKRCAKCKKLLSLRCFHGKYVETKGNWCKSCKNAYDRARYAKIGALPKRESIWKARGISFSWEAYCGLFNSQQGRCAICRKELVLYGKATGKKLQSVLDHDHTSGQVRGILCQRCNKALGLFDDAIEVLYDAINYLDAAAMKTGLERTKKADVPSI